MATPVLIDTSLDTHLVVPISSDSDTISDIKRKIMNEHLLLFPNTGEIKINAVKVKRREYLYHLSDSWLVKTVFGSVGVGCDWRLSVDASVAEEHMEDHNSIEPDSSNSLDLVPVDTGRRNEALLLQDGEDHHVKQISASQQFGSSDSIKENSEDLHKEAEHSANSNSQVPFIANNTVSRSNGDVGDDKICEDLPASVATPVSKKKLKSKKRKKDVIHHVLEEKVAIVEGENDALDSGNVLEENLFQNGPSLGMSDANFGNQIRVDKTSLRKKRSAARKRMVDERTEVPGEHHDLETNGHKDVSCNDQEHKSIENSLQSGPATKKQHKVEKKDDNENSLMEKVDQDTGMDTIGKKPESTTAVIPHSNTEFSNQSQLLAANLSVGKKNKVEKKDDNENSLMQKVDQDTGMDTIGKKPESTTAVIDHSNTEFSNQSQLLAANVSVGKKKRKRQQLKVSEVSPSKDVHEDTFQAIHAIKDKDLGSMVDPDSSVVKRSTGGEISEPCLVSPMNIQEVSERNRVLHPRGDDMDVANDGNVESKNEAPEPSKKPESTTAVIDHSNTEFSNQNQILAASVSVGKKKRKRQKSKVSEVSSSKDVHEDTFQAIHAIKDKDLGSMVDPDSSVVKRSTGGEISEPCLISPMNIQEVSERNRVHPGGDDDMDVANDGNMESKNEAPEPAVASVTNRRESCDQNSFHVDGHPTQESINFQKAFGVSAHENQSDNLEVVEENVEQNKSSKNDGNMESKNEAPEPAVPSVTNRRDSCDQNSFHVDGHPTQESINFRKAFGVSAHENQSDNLEVVEENVEQNKSSKKVKKSKKKSKGLVRGTDAVNAVRDSISPAKHPTFASDDVEQGGTADGKEEIKMKKLDCLPSDTDVRADDVIQDVLASLKQCNNGPENGENMEKKSKKKNRKNKKSSTVVPPPELQGKDDVDHRGPTVLVHNVSASSKSTQKTVKENSSSAVQLNGSDLESDKNTPKSQHDGRPVQDVGVDQTKSTCVDNGNNIKEFPDGSETLKSQQKHENVGLGKVRGKTGVATVANAKGKKKNSKPESESSSSDMLNGNKQKEAKAQPVKSSSIQSQRSSLKFEPSKPLLTVSGSAVKEPLQSNGSDNIDSTPKTAQRPIDINSSRASTYLKKNKTGGVSSSAFETPKNAINLKKGGNKPQSHLDFAKAPGSDSRKVANSSANKKSLLATMGTIFRHEDKESSEDEDGVGDSDSSTRTPSDSPSSFDYSGNSHENGSCNSEGEETSGGKKQKQASSSPKNMSLHAILLNSSSFKKAKLSASQDIDSQPEEFVPESQPT